MKTQQLTILFASVLGLGIFSLPATARADTDAVNMLVQDGAGVINGAAGFSFTPATNLMVTRVGYLEYVNASNPIVSIWSDTNFTIASFPLIPGANVGQMNYTNVSLVLLAGQRYSVTAQEGPLASGRPFFFRYSFDNTHFQVAAQLLNYSGATVVSSGIWDNFSPDVLLLGPNLSFQVQTLPLIAPALNIAVSNASTVVVSWPASPVGYVLQQNLFVQTTNWTLATNPVSLVNGTNQVTVSPLTSNRFFRLIHP